MVTARFTCTFMELKHWWRCLLVSVRKFYLYLYGIETYYELTGNVGLERFTCTFMELKQLFRSSVL